MKKKKQGDEISASQYMALAENARVINNFGSVVPSGQQFFLDKFIVSDTAEDERKRIEELR